MIAFARDLFLESWSRKLYVNLKLKTFILDVERDLFAEAVSILVSIKRNEIVRGYCRIHLIGSPVENRK